MEFLKKSLLALILLLVVVLAWVGSSIYFQNVSVDINPTAESLTKQLKNSFDSDILDVVIERSEQTFPVPPDEFLTLID
jgi:uncharacterized membrane protein